MSIGNEPEWLNWALGSGGFVAGALAAAGQVLVDWVAWTLVLPRRRPGALAAGFATSGSDPTAGLPIEAVARDGVRLAGRWHPAVAESRGVVILLHGFAEYPPVMASRVNALVGRNWDVAVLDPRGHGRSDGDRGSFGGREGDDLIAWVDSLVASGRIHANEGAVRVRAWGRSMGAVIALRAAASDPRFVALVLEAAYADLRRTLARLLRQRRLPVAGWFAGRVMARARRLAGVALDRPRPLDLAPLVRARALVIHGVSDAMVPIADARLLAAALPRAEPILEVPGAGHASVVEVGGPALMERVLGFLEEEA